MSYPIISHPSFIHGTQTQPKALRQFGFKNMAAVDYINAGMEYEDFFKNYLLQNKPCVLSQEYTDHWSSVHLWSDQFGEPNFKFLTEEFGQSIVPVADCNRKTFNSQEKKDMKFCDFLSIWEMLGSNSKGEEKTLYLKDWHFTRKFPQHHVYSVPIIFSSDWLNEYCENVDDDYKFVYMGPKGSWTPFHADVFRSNSWSANICGKKKWYLFPPGHEEYFRNRSSDLAYSIFSPELKKLKDFPNYANYKKDCIEVVQKSGEIIFVPSGWHHEVYNLENTISINQNWFNGCNIDLIWNALTKGLSAVEKEISDLFDSETFQQDCQTILNANHGMDYEKFFNLIKYIINKRITDLPVSLGAENFHCAYDIHKCVDVLEDMRKHMDEKKLKLGFEEELQEVAEVAGQEIQYLYQK